MYKIVFKHFRWSRGEEYEGVPLNEWIIESGRARLTETPPPDGSGYYYYHSGLFPNGGETHCLIHDVSPQSGNTVRIYTGIATCSVDDKYNDQDGEAIAFLRAAGMIRDVNVPSDLMEADLLRELELAYRGVLQFIANSGTRVVDLNPEPMHVLDGLSLYAQISKRLRWSNSSIRIRGE